MIFMTQSEAITAAKTVRPTDLADDILARFLSELEGRVAFELHKDLYWQDNGFLNIKFPYSKLYWMHLVRMIDFAAGDMARYKESSALFESAWQEYANYCQQTR